MTTTIAPPQPRIFRRYTGDSRCHNPGVTTAERYVTLYRSGRQWSATPDAPGSAHIVCAGYPYGSNRWALRAIEGLDGGMAPIVAEAWAYRSGGRLALLETLRVALEARLRRSVTHRGFENTMRGVGPTRAMGSASHEWDRIRLKFPFKIGVTVQKIALARAFMRDCEVIVLDEPTASLDAENEFRVFQQFRELTAEKMAVLISHRFSTVRMADRIYVIEQGEITERGTHEELLALGGTYARLFTLQAESYR